MPDRHASYRMALVALGALVVLADALAGVIALGPPRPQASTYPLLLAVADFP
jgi:hypothetical protein